MVLHLPEDLAAFTTDDHGIHASAAYALDLVKPDAPEERWTRHYEEFPPWWQSFLEAPVAVYVGATGDLLSRLEDHRDGHVRRASLLRICEIDGLRSVWFAEDYAAAEVAEYNLAATLRRELDAAFVHFR